MPLISDIDKKRVKLDYVAVILIVLVSDTIFFRFTLTAAISISIYFLFSLYYNRECKNHKSNSSLVYVVLLNLLLLRSYLLYPDLEDNQILGMSLESIASYLILKNFDLDNFKKKYLTIMFVICLYSLPIYIGNQLGFVTGKLSAGQVNTAYGVSLGFLGSNFDRFAGLFHEPGACMIFLNMCYLLYFKDLCDRSLDKKDKLKLIIITIALIATKSTGGYLIFLFIMMLVLLKTISIKMFIPICILSVGITYAIINSDVVQNKLSDKNPTVSKEARTAENLSCINMIINRPVDGYGLGSKVFAKQAESDMNYGNSNGLLHVTASLGILWLIIYLFFLYRSFGKLKLGLPPLLMIIPFLLLQCNERFIEYPISYVLLIQYGSYGLNRIKNGK